MSYRIQYGMSRVDKLPTSRFIKLHWLAAAVIFFGVLAATVIWPDQMEAFRMELLPFLAEPGKSAFYSLFENIDSETGLNEAVEVFVDEIIHAARN